jgi:hypothetical protein
MNKKQARDALTQYKAFLKRMDRVGVFLKVAEVCENVLESVTHRTIYRRSVLIAVKYRI